MTDIEDTHSVKSGGQKLTREELNAWFIREIIPLETALTRYLRRSWRAQDEIKDLRQDIYVRIYEAAKVKVPHPVKAFVFTTARNHLINQARRSLVVGIESVADIESLGIADEEPELERQIIAREDLRRLQTVLDRLPPRWRDVIVMRKVNGLSRSEIAARLGITEPTVSWHLGRAMTALAGLFHDERAQIEQANE